MRTRGAKPWCATLPAALLIGIATAIADPPPLPAASAKALPRWRGFNLLDKFDVAWSNRPFREEDFALIAELGFNFVRLPMDYRVWIVEGDWRRLNENALVDMDRAVAWGERYGLHVCINFHRAPGYRIGAADEPKSLWRDDEALEVCALHWAAFARRYRGIPNERLSFNLINEPPAEVDGPTYARVVRRLLEAIRAVDPDRLIICDGLAGGVFPCAELVPLGVAQAGRGYAPFGVTHYRAGWVDGAEALPLPAWPTTRVNAYLYGPVKPEFRSPLRIAGPFPAPGRARLHLGVVSGPVTLAAFDGERRLWERRFEPGPGDGEWKREHFRPEWTIYQNLYDRSYEFDLSEDAAEIRWELTEGDWITFVEFGWRPAGAPDAAERVLRPGGAAWGQKQAGVRFAAGDPDRPFRTDAMMDREWLRAEFVEPWRAIREKGVGVMIGEFGAYRHTPHDVVLRWMRDNLENWRDAGFGWALWEFRGPFGVLDSDRGDVEYEEFRGHRLDRRMLDLLQQY